MGTRETNTYGQGSRPVHTVLLSDKTDYKEYTSDLAGLS
jgi:hypothetical protein